MTELGSASADSSGSPRPGAGGQAQARQRSAEREETSSGHTERSRTSDSQEEEEVRAPEASGEQIHKEAGSAQVNLGYSRADENSDGDGIKSTVSLYHDDDRLSNLLRENTLSTYSLRERPTRDKFVKRRPVSTYCLSEYPSGRRYPLRPVSTLSLQLQPQPQPLQQQLYPDGGLPSQRWSILGLPDTTEEGLSSSPSLRATSMRSFSSAAGDSTASGPVCGCACSPVKSDAEMRPAVESQVTVEGRPASCWGRFRQAVKVVYRVLSSHLGLLFLLLAYSFAGAAIFQAIEGPHEAVEKHSLLDLREKLLSHLWNLTRGGNENETDFRRRAHSEILSYEKRLHAFKHGGDAETEMMDWDFWGSFLFCATVYTTIGYGHIAPVTPEGRVATMVYALIGIPLCLVVMAHLGRIFTKAIKFLWSFIRRFYYTGSCRRVRRTLPIRAIKRTLTRSVEHVSNASSQFDQPDVAGSTTELSTIDHGERLKAEREKYEIDENFNLPPVVAILIVVFYIVFGAAMYTRWENWNFLEAFYFIFISISTIGFGDVLPEHPKFFLATSFYILIGLSLVAMSITVIMEVVKSTINKAADKVIDVGQKIGISLSSENLDKIGREERKEQKRLRKESLLNANCELAKQSPDPSNDHVTATDATSYP